MKILIIPDKFKFTFSSEEIGNMISKSILNKVKAEITQLIVSDGGEGFLDSIEVVKNTRRIYHQTINCLFEEIESYFLHENETAYIEFAKTGGINLIEKTKRNPMFTSSYGLGQQIKEATKQGAKKIIIGLGGSATNDGGIGMAAALGYIFLDKKENILKPIGGNLIKINKIIVPKDITELKKIEFIVATDVENYLFGKKGAAFVYAEQKGASKDEIIILDQGLQNLHKILSTYSQKTRQKGDGAAGGLGFGIRTFLNGKIILGTEFIFNILNIENKIKNADIVITGEGKLDEQSFNGKLIGNIYNLTKKNKKPLIIIAGQSSINKALVNTTIYSLFDSSIDIKKAKKQTPIKINQIIKKIFL